MAKKIAIGLTVVLLLFIVFVALQPSDFRIERSAIMAAPAVKPFEQVNDFHKWSGWSPWEKLDPELKRTYSGAEQGEGAVYAWAGNDQVGEGKMTLLESRPHELIKIKLEFLRPFAATNMAEFTFAPEGDGTKVNWSMYGERNFMSKLFCLFMDMDKLVGGDFEKGLAAMKSLVEAGPKNEAATTAAP